MSVYAKIQYWVPWIMCSFTGISWVHVESNEAVAKLHKLCCQASLAFQACRNVRTYVLKDLRSKTKNISSKAEGDNINSIISVGLAGYRWLRTLLLKKLSLLSEILVMRNWHWESEYKPTSCSGPLQLDGILYRPMVVRHNWCTMRIVHQLRLTTIVYAIYKDSLGQCGLNCLWLRHCTCSASPLRLATYSQPAVIGLCVRSDQLTRWQRWFTAANSGPIWTHLWKNVIIFVTTTPTDKRHKTQQKSCTWSSRVCMSNFALVRRAV